MARLHLYTAVVMYTTSHVVLLVDPAKALLYHTLNFLQRNIEKYLCYRDDFGSVLPRFGTHSAVVFIISYTLTDLRGQIS
jgi:hypothetical protein